MADFGDAFLDFLKAYGYTSSLNALDTDATSQARVNAIFARHKNSFDSWMKCPEWLKDKYHGKIPYDILAKAAADPNFTETDAVRADIEHQKNNNPYSVVPDALREHPMYEPLCSCGAKFTAEQVAARKLVQQTYTRGGYSQKNAQAIAIEQAIRKALFAQRAAIEADKTLSDEERAKRLNENAQKILASRKREGSIKGNELENHPERAVICLLNDAQRGLLKREDVAHKISKKIQELVASDKLVLLAQQMAESRYQKRTRAETKDFFENLLKQNGVDPADMLKMQKEFMGSNAMQVSNENQQKQRAAYIQQQLQQMRFSR